MEPGYLTACEARSQKEIALSYGRAKLQEEKRQKELKESGAKFCASCNTYFDSWEEDELTNMGEIDSRLEGSNLCDICLYYHILEQEEKEWRRCTEVEAERLSREFVRR